MASERLSTPSDSLMRTRQDNAKDLMIDDSLNLPASPHPHTFCLCLCSVLLSLCSLNQWWSRWSGKRSEFDWRQTFSETFFLLRAIIETRRNHRDSSSNRCRSRKTPVVVFVSASKSFLFIVSFHRVAMSATIEFSLNIPVQSSQAHQIRPTLPALFADTDVQRTIAMNKISAALPKKFRLEAKKEFLPLTPTLVAAPSPINIDIQAKLGNRSSAARTRIGIPGLESLILKTVDCEMVDLFNQMVKHRFSHSVVRSADSFRNRNRPPRRSTRIYRPFSPNWFQVNTNISSATSSLRIRSIRCPMIKRLPCHR